MSEYIKLEDVKELIRTEWVKYMPSELDMNVSFVLGKMSGLPTIEVSDSADRPFEYFEGYEDGRKSIEVSEDAISRADILKYAYKRDGVMCVSVDSIKLAPSVTPKPKEGEWIEDEYGIPRCSECNCINNTVYRNYCSNCGARMKGADDERHDI